MRRHGSRDQRAAASRSIARKGLAAFAGAAVVALVAGCAGGGGEGGAASGDTPLLVAMDNGSPTFTANFNPFSPNKRTASLLIYEPLMVFNAIDGEGTPFIAESMEQPDARTVVFTIREGITWSDGEALTPDDVAFTLQLIKDFPALDVRGAWTNIESVAVDGQDVVVTLNGENVPAARAIAQTVIVPEHIWADVEDPTTFLNEQPVGAGPYVLGEFTPNEYTLDRNEDYWQVEAVAASELILPAANTELEIVNNQYDWAYSYMSDVDSTWGAAEEGNTHWFPPGGTISLMPNLTQAPFDDPEFRQGLSLALDRDRIADVAEEGYVEAAGTTGLLLPNQEAWLNPDIPDAGAVAQDVDAAEERFANAGYTMEGDRLVGPDGQQLEVTLTTPNGYTDWLRGATEVQEQLTAAGIAVTLNQPQPAAYQQELQNGNFELIIGSFGGTGSVYDDFNALMSSSFYQEVGSTTTANFQRFRSDEADALLDQLRVTTDEAEQREIGYQLQTIMHEELPVVPLFYGGLWGLFSEQRFTGWPSAEDPYATPQTWDANPLLIVTSIEAVE